MHKKNLKTSPSIDIVGSKTLISCYLVKLFFARLVFISFLVFSLIVYSIDVEAKDLRKADIVEKSLLNSKKLGLVAGLNDNAANKDINITAIDKVSIIASADTFRSNSKSETKTASVSVGGSIGASIGFQEAENSSKSTTYNNSLISAEGGALTVTSGGDTKLSGANLEAQDTALTVGGDLTVESLQNKSHSRSKSKGANIGFSSGGASVGFNFAKGNSDRTWVDDITSITGSNSVTINTAGNTHIKGAKIANENAAGEDLGNLTLATNSLTFENIKNSDETRNRGGGFSLSGIGGGEDQAADASKDNTTADSNKAPKGSTTISLINESRWKEGNTKATIGNGNITIGGNTATTAQLAGVNRDINNTEEITRDIIDGALNASVTIDNRLLSKEGRASIKDDFKTSGDLVVDIGGGVADLFTEKSTNLTGYGNTKTGLLKNIQEKLIKRNIGRNLASSTDGREATRVLGDESATPAQKQAARNYIAQVARAEGLSKETIESISYADSEDVSRGFHTRISDSLAGSTVFINEAKDENQNVGGTTKIIGEELHHAIDAQRGVNYDGAGGLREEYAKGAGQDFSSALTTAFAREDITFAGQRDNSGTDYETSFANDTLLRANSDFASLIPQSERENSAALILPAIGVAVKIAGKHFIKKEAKKKVAQKIVEQSVKAAATSALNQEELPTPEVEGAEGEEVNAKNKAEESRKIVSTGGGGDKEPDEERRAKIREQVKRDIAREFVNIEKNLEDAFKDENKRKHFGEQQDQRGFTNERARDILKEGKPYYKEANDSVTYIRQKPNGKYEGVSFSREGGRPKTIMDMRNINKQYIPLD